MKCKKCGMSLLWSTCTAGYPPKEYWVAMKNGALVFHCPADGEHEPEDWIQPVTDAVNHPIHYGGEDHPYEAIKVIEAWNLGFCLGNTVKYIARSGVKSAATEIEDLMKARWYLDRYIQFLQGLAVDTTSVELAAGHQMPKMFE